MNILVRFLAAAILALFAVLPASAEEVTCWPRPDIGPTVSECSNGMFISWYLELPYHAVVPGLAR